MVKKADTTGARMLSTIAHKTSRATCDGVLLHRTTNKLARIDIAQPCPSLNSGINPPGLVADCQVQRPAPRPTDKGCHAPWRMTTAGLTQNPWSTEKPLFYITNSLEKQSAAPGSSGVVVHGSRRVNAASWVPQGVATFWGEVLWSAQAGRSELNVLHG